MTDKNKSHKPTADEDEITETLLDFPCDFPIKVVGEKQDDLTIIVVNVIQSVLPDFDTTQISIRTSSGGRYISLTCVVKVESKPQLDAVYKALSQHPVVKFVL
jgi:uncharacterized protein